MQNEMRDRLIELIDIEYDGEPNCLLCEEASDKCQKCEHRWEYKLADHLIENGVIVPPCKICDVVWTCLNGYVSKAKVWGISTENYLYEQQIYLKVRMKDKSNFVFDKTLLFGKTVFLTKEEAEQKLKGGVKE